MRRSHCPDAIGAIYAAPLFPDAEGRPLTYSVGHKGAGSEQCAGFSGSRQTSNESQPGSNRSEAAEFTRMAFLRAATISDRT